MSSAVAEILALLDLDEIRAAVERDGADGPLPVSGPPITVGTGETAAEALARIDEAGAQHAVVIRDGRLAGLVTEGDLVRLRDAAAPSLKTAR